MGNTTTIKLSNEGAEVSVKRLGLFEIQDNVTQPDLSPYTVTILFANGEIYEQPFDLTVERIAPETPFELCEENSQDWLMWREYHRWQNGLAYAEKQNQALIEHLQAVDDYIKANCISAGDLAKVETFADWEQIIAAAISELTVDDLAHYANLIFRAKYDEVSPFEAQDNLPKSKGSYNWIAQLEYKLMRDLADTEEKYIGRPKRERANLILAELIPEMLAGLDMHDQMEQSKREAASNG